MLNVSYGNGDDISPAELAEFYQNLRHEPPADPARIQSMVDSSVAFVTARLNGRLIGIARGLCDGVRGYFSECKLDPQFQGPGAVTRTDGRIEHDEHGIAAEMARRVLAKLTAAGVERIDVLAWGTEVDFLEELGFRRPGGLVGMTRKAGDPAGAGGTAAPVPAEQAVGGHA